MRRPARLLDLGNFIEDFLIIAGEKRATIDDHIDFIGACSNRLSRLVNFD